MPLDCWACTERIIYHPPTFYIPIRAHLSLPSDAEKGGYRDKHVATDRIGGATRIYELTFELK